MKDIVQNPRGSKDYKRGIYCVNINLAVDGEIIVEGLLFGMEVVRKSGRKGTVACLAVPDHRSSGFEQGSVSGDRKTT